MKIIHLVLGKANPERLNGVNKVVYQLATHQTRLGFDVSLWGLTKNPVHDYPPRNFATVLFRQNRNPFSLSAELIEAIKALPKTSIVHIHGAFIPVFFRIAGRLYHRGVPYVYTPHGALTQGAMKKNSGVKQVYFSLLEKRLIRRAKAVQMLGASEYNDLDHLLKIPHKWLIPNGQELSEIPDLQVAAKEEPVFGFCGRLDREHKGLDLILEGFAHYLSHQGKGRLEFIGDGKDRAWLEEAIQARHLEERVVLHGARFGDEKFQRLAGFDVFLHPSRMEGFPTAVLEAAAMRLPCITSEETSVNEFIREFDAGFPLPVNSPAAIAEAMTEASRCWEKGCLPKKGRNARQMVETLFHWPAIAAKLIQLYQS